MKDVDQMLTDKFCYVVQSAYLKFPTLFRRRFNIGTHIKLDERFPNPKVGVDEDTKFDRIQIVYEFKISELEAWKNKTKGS